MVIKRKRKIKILVVEDDVTVQGLIKLVLQVLDFDVDTAISLNRAKEVLKHNEYSYILLDLNLSDTNGIDTLRSVKKLTDTKIIIITGINDTKIKDECLKLGIYDFLWKGSIHSDYFEKLKEENNE